MTIFYKKNKQGRNVCKITWRKYVYKNIGSENLTATSPYPLFSQQTVGRASDPSIISITHIICHHLYLYSSLLFITISICNCHYIHQYSSSVSFISISKNTDIFLLQIHCLWGNSLSSMFFHSPVCGKTQAIASLWQMWS